MAAGKIIRLSSILAKEGHFGQEGFFSLLAHNENRIDDLQ
jgi:hypothetical protein